MPHIIRAYLLNIALSFQLRFETSILAVSRYIQTVYHMIIYSSVGLEVASYMCEKAESIHVICRGECPLQHVFGKRVGRVFTKVIP